MLLLSAKSELMSRWGQWCFDGTVLMASVLGLITSNNKIVYISDRLSDNCIELHFMSISLLVFQASTACLFLQAGIEIVCPNRTHQQNDKKIHLFLHCYLSSIFPVGFKVNLKFQFRILTDILCELKRSNHVY